MRVVFMGTPDFAVPSLRALAREHDVVAVYTRADAASGRGGTLLPSPVKQAALELGVAVHEPRTLRDEAVLGELQALGADIVVVAAYGMILPRPALDAGRLGAVNVHASLLPRWRGAAPIQRAILAGDETAGISIMRMEEGLDTGQYCLQRSLAVDDLSTPELTSALAELGARALVEALPAIESGSAAWTVQDEALVTYADKIAKSDVALDPSLTVTDFLRRVRASSPAAPARLSIAEKGATVMRAQASGEPLAPGSIACTKTALSLGVADGAVTLVELKPDGKPAMDACAWARGVRDIAAASWGAPL